MWRRVSRVIWLCCVALVCVLPLCAVAVSAPDASDQVLLLNSYHRGLLWTDQVTAGVESVLHADPSVDLQITHMDTKRMSDEGYLEDLYDFYRSRFRASRFKVVICSDDHAFSFLLDRHAQLFPGASIVFCGVNYFSEDRLKGQPDITGVVEAFDIEGTLSLAVEQNPLSRNLVIINDDTATGEANRKVLDEILPQFASQFDVTYLSDLSMAELKKEVQSLPEDSVILLMSYTRDGEGAVFSYEESIREINSVCSVPMYGIWDFYLGFGIVGGRLTSGFDQGRTAAQMAQRILGGEDASAIPVVLESPNRYMFDYEKLAEFGIDRRHLPPESIVKNLPPSALKVDTHLVWIIISIVILLILLVLILIVERHERRRADRALQKEMAIFKSGPVVLFKWQNEEGWPVEYVSQNVNQFGYAPDDLTSGRLPYDQLIHPADLERVGEEVARYTAAGVPYFEQHYRLLLADGSIRWIYDITHVIREHDEVTHYQGYLLDVSRRRLAEEREKELRTQLGRAERLKSLGELAGGVAHDLNNILGPLVGYPDLILRALPEDSSVRNCVRDIKYSARRAATVIQDLLTLARRGAFEVRPVSINEIVETYMASGSFRSIQEQQPEVHLNISLGGDLPMIAGSASHVSRVVMNLILNAYEAISGEGTLMVTTERRHVDKPLRAYTTVREGEYVVIHVSDTGCGMSPAELERIFDPFYTKRKMGRSGTGLGLAVVYGVMKDHGGYIDVDSAPGEGSSFTLYFPTADETIEQEPTVQSPQGGDETVLVVDDRRDQLDLSEQMLSTLGYKVATAEGGRAAIDYLKQHKVDLVMLDMIMEEGFDGLDTYRSVLQMYPEQPCVITSGYAETDRVHKAMELGAGTYLRKPYTLLHLDQAIRAELGRSSGS